MDFVVVDTDVASNIHKDRLPGALAARLTGKTLVVTFVTVGELTQWVELRQWGPRRRAELDSWLEGVVEIGYEPQVARMWGRLGGCHPARHGSPRQRHVDRRLLSDPWATSGQMNLKDYEDFSDHHGLVVL